jgi:hypothetical protein
MAINVSVSLAIDIPVVNTKKSRRMIMINVLMIFVTLIVVYITKKSIAMMMMPVLMILVNQKPDV